MQLSAYPTSAYTSKQCTDSLLHHLARRNHVFHLCDPPSTTADKSVNPYATFPVLSLLDGTSNSHLALYVCKGQHKSQKTKIYIGAVRQLCNNPMIFANNPGLNLVDKGVLPEELPELLGQLPNIRCGKQKRINWLQRLRSKEGHIQTISERISQDFNQRLQEQLKVSKLTQWQLLNLITHYISHEVEQSKQLPMLLETSKIFEL